MNKEQPYLSFNMIVQNEAKRIEPTLKCIKDIADEIVIIDGGSKDNTVSLCKKYTDKVYYNNFSGDFAFQKNFANFKCSGRWIFNIDADETLNPQLIKDLKDLLKVNENIDIFYLARLNKIQNLDMKYAQKWRWTIDKENRINWPDWQGRVYKRSGNLMWDGKVHERIVGYNNYAVLPEKYFLIHEKTMDKQIEQNLYYEKIQQRRNI